MSVVIVGGGIAGLATAYRLRQGDPSLQITLIERDPQLGGKIVTAEQDGPFWPSKNRGAWPWPASWA